MKKCPKCELNYIKDDEETCKVCKPQIADTKEQGKTFYSMGLNGGEVIKYIFDTKITASIYSERTVLFENKEWHLTPLMVELGKRTGNKTTYGSGFEVFKYDDNDINLYVRWYRFNQQADTEI